MQVLQAYRFALDPTPRQASALASHCGAARVAFNWGLALVKANLAQRAAERSYGLRGDQLTPPVPWSMYTLRKRWNTVKHEVAPWWAECSKEAYACGLERLAAALANWRTSANGTRNGPPVSFPRFKSKHRSVQSVRFTTGAIRLEGRAHVVLPVLGRIKTHESTRKLSRRIEQGTATIRSATVRKEAGRWFVAFSVLVQRIVRSPRQPEAIIGVDLGVKTLAVFSDHRPAAENPGHLATALRRLRRLSRTVARRQGPDRRSGQSPSKRWARANAQRNRVHHRVAHLRHNALHKLTSDLARAYGSIVIEDLNVAGMLRNRRLARAVADAGFGEIRRQLTYKTKWNGGSLIVADRWYPSSKTCSGCGAVKAKLPLRVRTYVCAFCGLRIDRDRNAAINLASLVKRVVAGSGSETRNGRGADPKPSPGVAGGCEASTPQRVLAPGSDGDLRLRRIADRLGERRRELPVV
ncbi:IS607 family element RNA-guided endonuclease TnpB [Nonomuraea sp. NPDC050451]|uniref:IS607 family element RNA-guided endonuclease TnpB n=1 Tax=Nonomuraea sp. NPDC050451 TaxID=3364364 RepID=UPI0037AFFD53